MKGEISFSRAVAYEVAAKTTATPSFIPRGASWRHQDNPRTEHEHSAGTSSSSSSGSTGENKARVAIDAAFFANIIVGNLTVLHEEQVGGNNSAGCDDPSPLASLSGWAFGHSAFPLSLGASSATESEANQTRQICRILTRELATLSDMTRLRLTSQEKPLFSTYLHTYLLTYLPTNLLTYLPTYLLTNLLTYLLLLSDCERTWSDQRFLS